MDDSTPEPLGPYQRSAAQYYRAGYHPLPVIGKAINLPEGFTGYRGRLLTYTDVVGFIFERPDDNVALRANGWVGVDIDHYVTKDGKVKTGGNTLALAEAIWGRLEPTWRLTARHDDPVSGIRFYRIAEGDPHLATIVKLPDENGELHGDIEIVQWSHRYAVAWPSIHPDLGTEYRWYQPDGTLAPEGVIPDLQRDIPPFAIGWIEGLRRDAPNPELDRDPILITPQRAAMEAWHPRVVEHYADGLLAANGESGTRHDTTGVVLGRLARDEEIGRSGATSAIEKLRDVFIVSIGRPDAAGEYDRMVAHSRRQAASTLSLRELERRRMEEIFGGLPDLGFIGPRALLEPGDPVPIDPDAPDPFPVEVFGIWKPVDVRPYLEPDWTPEPPTLFSRSDGRALWYRGNVNWLHGASGSGKTWVALIAAVQEMKAGRHVSWVHYEDPLPDKLINRLKLLGATNDEIIEYFHVMVVNTSMVDGMQYLRPINTYYRSGFVVLDSVGEAIGADGVAVKDDDRFTKWIHGTIRTLAADGLSVLGIDHVPMGDAERLDPVGSFRKRAAVTGSMFLATSPRPFGLAQAGNIKLVCAKDRSGAWVRGETAAFIEIAPEEERVDWRVEAPRPKPAKGSDEDGGDDGEAIEEVVARHAYRVVAGATGPMSLRMVEAGMSEVKARASTKRQGIDIAVYRGWLVESPGPRGARLFTPGRAPEGM